MSNLTSEMKTKMNGAAKEFHSHVPSVENMGEQAGEVAAQAFAQAQDYYQAGRRYVKSNPEKSVALAAAGGLVLGSLLTFILRRR